MTEIIKIEDFKNRSDLDSYIRAEYGDNLNENLNLDVEIQGKREELKRLYLTDKSRIWGIRCRITDLPTKEVIRNRPKSADNNAKATL